MSLDPRAKALLERARPGFEASPSDATRNERALVATLGLSGGVAATAAAKSAGGTSGAGSADIAGRAAGQSAGVGKSLWVAKLASASIGKVVGIALVTTTIGGLGGLAWRSTRDTGVPETQATTRVVTAQPSVTNERPSDADDAEATRIDAEATRIDAEATRIRALAIAAEQPPAATPSNSSANAAARRTVMPRANVEAEIRLVREGMALLDADRAAEALRSFDEHARLFPNGTLAEEGSVGRIRALCTLDRTTEARMERERFLARHSTSPHASTVRTICATRR